MSSIELASVRLQRQVQKRKVNARLLTSVLPAKQAIVREGLLLVAAGSGFLCNVRTSLHQVLLVTVRVLSRVNDHVSNFQLILRERKVIESAATQRHETPPTILG